MTDYIYLSQEGYDKLKAELHELKTVQRPRIVGEIKRARELGDLAENAEYHAAKETQAHIERKIAELEFKLTRAQVVRTTGQDPDTAALLARVSLRDLEDGEEVTYQIVAAAEADLAHNKISIESPVGKALVGRRAGDRVQVQTPGGEVAYEILKIEAHGAEA